jgi:hypothetical protein
VRTRTLGANDAAHESAWRRIDIRSLVLEDGRHVGVSDVGGCGQL